MLDLKRTFVTDYIFPAIRANAKYEGRYLLGTSLARPLTSKAQIDLAKELGAQVVSHGATGKGNDQVRFELLYRTLMPKIEIYAPWKDQVFLDKFKGRTDMIEFAEQYGIPIAQSKSDPWSSDDNCMHISYEAGMLEDPAAIPLERMFNMTVSPKDAPDKETIIQVGFSSGNPVYVQEYVNPEISDGKFTFLSQNCNENAINYTKDPVELFAFLNQIGGANGIGRDDIVESRYVGMKSRGVYETPAGAILHFAHKDLEGMTLDREIINMNQHTSIDLAEKIYSGFWFSPEREAMQASIDRSQKWVNGWVRLGLYKGNIIPRGRGSGTSLYNSKIASMDEEGGYDQTKARGFIDITAVRLQASRDRLNLE